MPYIYMLAQTYNLQYEKYLLLQENFTHTHTHMYVFVFIKLYCTSHDMYLRMYVLRLYT